MKTKYQRMRFGVAALIMVACHICAFGDDAGFDRLVIRWKNEREQLLKRMTRSWLQENNPSGMQADLMTLSRLESGLVTRHNEFLYIGAIKNAFDVESSAASVVQAYLRNRGALVDSADFFRGRTFGVIRHGAGPVPRLADRTSSRRPGRTVIGKSPDDKPAVTEVETVETRYLNMP